MIRSPNSPSAFRALCLALIGGLAVAGCEGQAGRETETLAADDTLPPATERPRPAGGMSGAEPGRLDDGDVVATLSAADQAEIRPSELARERAENSQVRQFAERMVTEHRALSDSLRMFAQRENLTAQETALSRQMQSQTDTTLQRLEGLSGAEFDRAYMEFMERSHQNALQTIDTQLLRAVQDPELRTALQRQVRPAVAGHLEEARELRSQLGMP